MNIENSICHDITTDRFDAELLAFEPQKQNSKLKLGNLTFFTDKKINLFHRIMFRILLGVKVERIKNGKKTI